MSDAMRSEEWLLCWAPGAPLLPCTGDGCPQEGTTIHGIISMVLSSESRPGKEGAGGGVGGIGLLVLLRKETQRDGHELLIGRRVQRWG